VVVSGRLKRRHQHLARPTPELKPDDALIVITALTTTPRDLAPGQASKRCLRPVSCPSARHSHRFGQSCDLCSVLISSILRFRFPIGGFKE